jgi:hypothetical protein
MSPKDFREWYTNLSVNSFDAGGNQYVFSGLHVDKYAMNDTSNQTSGQKAIDTIRSQVNARNQSFQTSAPDSAGWAIPMDNLAFIYASIFRGTPAQLEYILNVGIQCRYFKNPTQQSLQQFIDDSFRTDCVGFVSSYFRQERGNAFFTLDNVANHGCGPFYDKAKAAGSFVWYPRDIREQDVLLWMLEDRTETRSPGHISLVQSVSAPPEDGGTYQLHCVESNGAQNTKDPKETVRSMKSTGKQDTDGNYIYWKGPDGKSYIELTDGAKVIIIRLS